MASTAPRLILFLLVGFLPALPGFFFRPTDWYGDLTKPPFNPPNWVFAPMWMLLYLSIGVATWLFASRSEGAVRRQGLTAWGAQLVLNALWPACFFGLKNPALALADIVLLMAAVLTTILLFNRRSQTAAWLLLPYLAWVGFATYLNAGIWLLNRG